jgi:hypothetical protein
MVFIMRLSYLLLAFLCLGLYPAAAQNFSEKNLRKYVKYLASDKMQGRGTGTAEEAKAAEYLADAFKKMGLQPKGNNNTWFHDFGFTPNSNPHSAQPASAKPVMSRNVAAYLDNGAPYTIVIGAHYDHLGLGHDHNSLDPNPEGKIHNGADDNASGTAGVLELARYFSQNDQKESHNFLFLCFSGEELGLVGSKRFTEYPTIELDKVSFMVNLDMIGRLNPEKRILVGGVGTAPDFVPLLNSFSTGLSINKDSAGVGPSDHTSFYLKNIPVLFFFTGQHKDYHKPTDDVDLVNYPGMVQVLELVSGMVEALDKTPKLTFQETKSNKTDTPSFKVTLGIMPDYVWDQEGVHVDGVTDGRPASKAGLKQGDVILGLGDYPVKNMQDYMQCLSKFEKGQSTTVKIRRGATDMVLPVTF